MCILSVPQLLELHRAEGNHFLSKSPRNWLKVCASPNQDSDAKLAVLALRCFDSGPVFLDDVDHLPGFRIFGCPFFLRAWPGDTEKWPHFDTQLAARRRAMRLRRSEGDLIFLSCAGSEDLREDFVQALDQSGVR